MTTVEHALLFAFAALLPMTAAAQDSVTRFRLKQDPKNIQSCAPYDSSLTRVHTFTVKDGQARIESVGGINDKMNLVRPNVYETVFSLSGVRVHVVADLGSTPRTLTVTERRRGCKYLGAPEE